MSEPNHGVCIPLPKAKQAMKNWHRSLNEEIYRAGRLNHRHLSKSSWERIANAAAMCAHYGRCVQIQLTEQRSLGK